MNTEQATVLPETVGPYRFQHMIGRGGFSLVYAAIHEPTNTTVAIKVIARARLAPEKFERELLLMKKLDHPFIVAFYDFIEDDHNYYLVMEYCEHGTLLDRVTQSGGLPEPLIKSVMCELVCALNYLHSEMKVAHRDIKLENIMLDRNNHIRLIDFGLGQMFSGNGQCLHTACGSPIYASPEMLSGQMYGISSDVWSAGVVLYSMAYGTLPFQANHIHRLMTMIQTEEPDYNECVSPELIDLMKRMLLKDVDLRITVRQMRMHGWIFSDPRMKIYGPQFGLATNWRCKDGQFLVNEQILARLPQLGVSDVGKVREELEDGVFNSQTAVYRMQHREEVMKGVKEMEAQFEKPASFITRPNTTLREIRSVLDKMKLRRRDESNNTLPPLQDAKGCLEARAKSMNPQRTRMVYQGPHITKRTRLLTTARAAITPTILVRVSREQIV